MSETYNPRERSFIKMPEVKCCPACGQILPSDVKPMTNYMHPVTGNVICLNTPYADQPTVVIQDQVYHLAKKNEHGKFVMVNPPSASTESAPVIETSFKPVILPDRIVSKLQAAQAASQNK